MVRHKTEKKGRKQMKKIFGGIGFILFLIGIGCMDSISVIVPVVMIFAGLGIMLFSAKGEEINDTV